MKTLKMSLANIKGKMSRSEMKSIKGGILNPVEKCLHACGPTNPCAVECGECTSDENTGISRCAF
jgi:hypothetical protein